MVRAVRPVRPASVVARPPHPADISWHAWWRGVRASLQNPKRDYFTVDKAYRLLAYAQHASIGRQLLVVAISPGPGLLVSLLAPLVPLQDPSLDVAQNPGYVVHFFVTLCLGMGGTIMQMRPVCDMSHADYPTHLVAVVSVVATLLFLSCAVCLGCVWRFPVPFSWVVLLPAWTASFLTAHAIVLRGRLRRAHYVWHRLLMYLQSHTIQVSQVLIYATYSAVFEAASTHVQLVLIACFPLLKFGIRRLTLAFAHQLGAYSHEVATYNVEVCATMYQAVIMQNAPSPLALALLIAVDVVQGFLFMWRFLDQGAAVPTNQLLRKASKRIQSGDTPMNPPPEELFDEEATTDNDSIPLRLEGAIARCWCRLSVRIARVEPATRVVRVGPVHPRPCITSEQAEQRALQKALECWHAVETILLIEYLEVAIPLINILYVVLVSPLDSARYNTRLREFHTNPSSLRAALASILLYIVLQAATLVVVAAVVRARYRVSPLAILAFALEHRVWAFQGRMLAWLPVILVFPIVHYGADFTFKFDFSGPY